MASDIGTKRKGVILEPVGNGRSGECFPATWPCRRSKQTLSSIDHSHANERLPSAQQTGGSHDCIERPVPPCPARRRSVYRFSTSGTPGLRSSYGSSTDGAGKEGPRPIHRSVAAALCPIHCSIAAALCGPAKIDILPHR